MFEVCRLSELKGLDLYSKIPIEKKRTAIGDGGTGSADVEPESFVNEEHVLKVNPFNSDVEE